MQLRPRYLELEGLQSYIEQQCIDFDKLGELGLFGIFGPTGSGKSTILDAITLALYGKIQRADRGTQGIINTSIDQIRVVFEFDLTRDNQRKTFRVERTYRRKKDSENSIEGRLARLFEVGPEENRIIADKQGEVNNAVIELVGLQFDDFTRSVVLPQNKFHEFLLSPKAEKTKMLERIFYLEEYGRKLTDKVNSRLSLVRHRLSGIEGGMATLGDVSEEGLKRMEESLHSHKTLKEKIDRELREIENVFNDARERRSLTEQLDEVRKKQLELEEKDPYINLSRVRLKNAIRAGEIAERLWHFEELKQKLKEALEKFQCVNESFPTMQMEACKAQKDYEEKSQSTKREMPNIIERRANLAEALVLTDEIAKTNERLRSLRSEFSELKDKVEKKAVEIADLRKNIETSEEKLQHNKKLIESKKVDGLYRRELQKGIKLEDELNRVKSELNQQEEKYQKQEAKSMELRTLLKEQEQQADLLSRALAEVQRNVLLHKERKTLGMEELHQISISCRELKLRQERIQERNMTLKLTQERLNSIMLTQTQTKQQGEKLQEQLVVREKQCSGLEEQLQALRKLSELNTALSLRHSLNEGDACPVCGGTYNPHQVEAIKNEDPYTDYQEKIKFIQSEIDRVKKEIHSNEKEAIRRKEQHIALVNQENELLQSIKNLKDELDALWKGLPQEIKGLDMEGLQKHLNAEEQRYLKGRQEAEEWEAENTRLSGEASTKEMELNKYNTEIAVKRSELSALEAMQKELSLTLSSLTLNSQNKLEAYTASLAKLQIQCFEKELKRVEAEEQEIERLSKENDKILSDIAKLRTQLEAEDGIRNSFASKLVDIEAEGRSLRQQVLEKQEKIKKIASDKDIHKEQRAIEERIKLLEKEEEEALKRMKACSEALNNAVAEKSSLEKQLHLYETRRNEEEALLNAMLAQREFKSVEDAKSAMLPPEEVEKISEEIRRYDELLSSYRAHSTMILSRLGNRRVEKEEWLNLCESYEAKKVEKEECIARFEAIKNQYENMLGNYSKWVQLLKEAKGMKKKRDNLELIQKLLKGNSFIEYIAEERLRYIAKEASETLGVLTKFRYGLELDSDNGFVIRDNANGGVHRLVTSLSGGETFLTSLSLALALSSQIQLKGQSPLEFFFLDEGFGTLDSSLLDTVVDSLERLSSFKRVIGIISHVPEIKNRIARRLLVEQSGQPGTGSRVRIERA